MAKWHDTYNAPANPRRIWRHITMTTTMPTRAQIERAEPLDMNTTRSERQANITISGTMDGFTVQIEFTSAISAIPAAIDRLKALGLSARQERTMTPTAAPAAPQRRETVEPIYQPDGTACCPVHKRELSQGQYGLFCPTKAQPGQASNPKGYCSLRFSE